MEKSKNSKQFNFRSFEFDRVFSAKKQADETKNGKPTFSSQSRREETLKKLKEKADERILYP